MTGAAGLLYQVVWQRYLTRMFGGEQLATAVVLAVFLGGLSLGYFLCGRLTTRVRRVLVTYGILEAGIGLWALMFPLLFRATDSISAGWSFAPPGALVFQGTICGVLLIGPPTLCMGATVPMLTRGLTDELGEATRVHARIYAVNTAGAVLGALATGFVLIEWFGLPTTLRLAAILNLSAGAFFVWVAPSGSSAGKERTDATRVTAPASPFRPSRWILLIIAFVGGTYFMTLEVLLIRVTNLSLGSSSYSFSLVVAAVVLCIAVGAGLVSRRATPGPSALWINQCCVVVGGIVLFLTLDSWSYAAHLLRIAFAGSAPGFVLFYLAAFVVLTITLLVPLGCIGATLPLVFHSLRKDMGTLGARAGTLYAWNALGNLTGGLVGGFVLYHWLGHGEMFAFVLVLATATAWLASIGQTRLRWAVTGVVTVGVFITLGVFPFDPLRFAVGTFRLREPLEFSYRGAQAFFEEYYGTRTVLAYRDDPEGTFAVIENLTLTEALAQKFPRLLTSVLEDGQSIEPTGPRPRSVMVNGKADSSTYYDRDTLKVLAHLPALLGSRRERVFIIGLGTGITAAEFTLYPEVRSIEVAEISPAVVDFMPLFEESTHGLAADPRLELIVGDAFRVLRRSSETWDIIISEPSNPWVNGVDQLFSREFYEVVRERLHPEGMFVQWVQRYTTTEAISGMAINTMLAEFPHVRSFRVEHDELLLASPRPLDGSDLERAAMLLASHPSVARSLEDIEVRSLEDLLAYESGESLEAAASHADLGYETLDRPRIHYMAGRAFFAGDSLD